MICDISGFAGSSSDLQQLLSRGGKDDVVDSTILVVPDRRVERALIDRVGAQRYAISPQVRRAIESRAMTLAEEYFARQGWAVDPSVATFCPYDLRCTRPGSQELHVEVKGTVGPGSDILLTKNEVKHAEDYYPNVALAVVSDIEIDRAGPIRATGGVLRVLTPWKLNRSRLTALAYEYEIACDSDAQAGAAAI
jgi:hypothetical protein